MAVALLVFGRGSRIYQLVVAFAAVALVTSTASADIAHQWTFNHGAYDSVGGAHGTLVGQKGQFAPGYLDLTGNVDGDNSDLATGGSYVDLPNNLLTNLNGQFSIETWFTLPENPTYSFLWSFGVDGSGVEGTANGGGEYIGLIAPHANTTTRGIATDPPIEGVPEEQQFDFYGAGGTAFPTDELQHYVVTFDITDDSVPPPAGESAGTFSVYWNGEYMGSQFIVPYFDLTDFQDVNSWIGRANWNDPLFDGTVTEFTIHDEVLTAGEIEARFNAGPAPDPTQGVPGDVNGDGAVDLLDWNVIKMNMFTPQGTIAAGDISFDGFVDQADFRLWKDAYLAGGGSAAIFGENGFVAVPEPSSFILITAFVVVALAAFRRRFIGSALGLVLAVGISTAKADTEWVGPPAGAGDYADGDNWLSLDGFPGVPDITFDSYALIQAGMVNLSTDMAPVVGPEIRIEGTAPVVFNISSGGALTLDGNFSFHANNNPDSAFNMTGGSLTAHSLWMFGENPRKLSLSGDASISAIWPDGGGVYFPPSLRIEGPNVTVEALNMYGYVEFQNMGTYTAVITGPEHSTITSNRDAYINGNLVLEFEGYTPTMGDSYDIVSAGALLTGNRRFETLDASSAGPLPAGAIWYQSIVPGAGGVGETLRVGVIRQLELTVDRSTNEVRINNFGNAPSAFQAYTLADSKGAIGLANWNSLDDQNLGTFSEAAMPTNMEISESATTGLDIAAGSYLSLGNLYAPQPTIIGEEVELMTFSYTTPSGLVVDLPVTYEGLGRNNLVVTVDPATGQATVENESDFTIQVDGYTLTSTGGSLSGSGWNSFEDRGMAGWDETNATANRLAEFNIESAMTLAPGATFTLGQVFNTGGGMDQDLAFEFLLSDQSEFIEGVVLYGPGGGGLDGDFNGDGFVDAADYTVWRDGLGGAYANADYLLWKNNFGASSAGGSVAISKVPEPTAASLLAALFGGVGFSLTRRKI